MIIIYILAAIGGLFTVGMVGLGILLICARGKTAWGEEPVCILSGETCTNTDATTGTCENCDLAKEYLSKKQEGAE